MNNTGLNFILVFLSLACLFTGCSKENASNLDSVVSIVGDKEINNREVLDILKKRLDFKGLSFEQVDHSNITFMTSQILRELVDLEVLNQMASEDLRKQAKKLADQEFKRREQQAGSSENLQKEIASLEYDFDLFRQNLYLQTLLQLLANKERLSTPKFAESDLRKVYDENPSQWQESEKYDVTLLLVDVQSKEVQKQSMDFIKGVKQQVNRGQSYQKAIESSKKQFPNVAFESKKVRFVEGQTNAKFLEVAASLKNGEVSDIIGTGQQLILIRLDEVIPGKQSSYLEVKEKIYDQLVIEKKDEQLSNLLLKWRKEVGVKNLMTETSIRKPHGRLSSLIESIVVVIILSVLCYATFYYRGLLGLDKWPLIALLLGTLLRFGLWQVTPYDLLSNDPEAHLGYVGYVAEHGQVPSLEYSFMSYQPPLYYFLAAPLALLSDDILNGARYIQILGLLISVLTLVIGLWLLKFLLPDKEDLFLSKLPSFILAVYPSLFFFAPRVNNDVLFMLLITLAMAFFMKWWKDPTNSRFLIFSTIVSALALLTKSNSLLFLPVLGIGLLVHQKIEWKQKIQWVAICGGIGFVISGWFYIMRFMAEGQSDLAGNLSHISEILYVDTSWKSLITFNPIKLLQQPFIELMVPGRDRDMFLEYYFRSSLFDHFNFPDVPIILLQCLIISALGILILGLLGFFMQNVRDWHKSLPMTILFLSFFFGHMMYRQIAPFSSSQNFRYSIIVLIPLIYFFMMSASYLPPSFRWVHKVAGGLFVMTSCLFLGHVIID